MRMIFLIVGIIVAAFVIAPILVVVPMSLSTSSTMEFPPPGYSFANFRAFFSNVTWTGPTINSFIIAAGTTVLTTLLVTPAAFAMVRHRFYGRSVINVLLLMPLVVPHIVIAVGYYFYFGQLGLLQTYTGVIFAHVCLTAPLTFLTISASLKGFDRSLERAAQSLGAPPIVAFLTVTVPVLAPTFAVAGLLSFVHSFDETTTALFISGRDVATLPKRMFDSIRLDADPVLSVAATLLFAVVLLAFAGLALLPVLSRRFSRTQRTPS